MQNSHEKIKLQDLIDINLLQELQDSFANIMGVASLAVDDNGPITKPSNFTDFCSKYTRGSKEGYRRCNQCDITWGKIAADSKKPVIYDCHSGLRDFAVPIIINDQHVASILGGQVLTQEPDEKHFRKLAKELGIDEDEYIEAVKKIKVIPAERVEAAANFLYFVANTISKVAHKNFELIRKNNTSILYRKITEAIRSSLDLENTLELICKETAKLFDVQRSAVTYFPEPGDYRKYKIKKEYKVSNAIHSFPSSIDSTFVAQYWASEVFSKNKILAIDNIETADVPDSFKQVYLSMGVKSVIGVSIKKGQNIWGTLILSEYLRYRVWTEEEKELLSTVSDQIYIAINQAELFEKMQQTAQNEKTLREIMLACVQKFDIKQILKEIVTHAGMLFKADRCFFIEVNLSTRSTAPIKDYAEYLSSERIMSHRLRDPLSEEVEVFLNKASPGKVIICENLYQEDLPQSTKDMLLYLGVKSYLTVPVYYSEKLYGTLVLHYVEDYKKFSQEEEEMILAIASQSAIIINQAELFEITKIQAERERISRNIIEILRSSIDKVIIKKLFVKNIGKFFKADRVFFSDYDSVNKKYLPVDKDAEYLSTPSEMSFVGFDWAKPDVKACIMPLLEKREIKIPDWSKYVAKEENLPPAVLQLYKDAKFQSTYGFPVIYQSHLIGFFCLDFSKEVVILSEEDLMRIRSICTQAGIALYHANLYQRAQKSVKAHAEFVNKLSSELKEPLGLIIEFSEKLMKQERADEEETMLFNIRESAKKLIIFIEDVEASAKVNLDFG